MLREYDIDRHSRWPEVKKKVDGDSRYRAVESSFQREDYFHDYCKLIKEEKRKAKDKDRDRKEKRDREKHDRDKKDKRDGKDKEKRRSSRESDREDSKGDDKVRKDSTKDDQVSAAIIVRWWKILKQYFFFTGGW